LQYNIWQYLKILQNKQIEKSDHTTQAFGGKRVGLYISVKKNFKIKAMANPQHNKLSSFVTIGPKKKCFFGFLDLIYRTNPVKSGHATQTFGGHFVWACIAV
jgi:hypothetical protein